MVFNDYLQKNLQLQGLLKLFPETNLNSRYRSGATFLSDTRPVSIGIQVFETNQTVWPVTQPIQKEEALVRQTMSGEQWLQFI